MVSLSSMRWAFLWAATCAQAALDVDLNSPASIKAAAKVVAHNLISTYYHGDEPGQIPGILPGPPPGGPYYWWEGGALWGTMVDYWHYTNDTTYNNITTQALIFQSENSYMPLNWTASLGNDDQGFWGMSVMLAAEVGYPDPPSGTPGWLALAQAVFNTMAWRWDTKNCGGGLLWQINLLNKGSDYKNTIANGILFNLAARLARYTHNDTYAGWAEKAWDWLVALKYIDDQYNIYDGAHIEDNCTIIDKGQWSYNAAVLAEGLAYMYDYSNRSSKWQTRLQGLLNRTLDFFFPDGILVEIMCEHPDSIGCTTDELSFKGYMHRWLATATQLAPFTNATVMARLRTSAAGAVRSCEPDGTCGFRWNTGSYDGDTGAGQEMSALAALSSLLVTQQGVRAPLTDTTGGTSKGDPAAGNDATQPGAPLAPVTKADRAGAAVLTTAVLASLFGGIWWLLRDETKPAAPRWWRGRE
ncbi:glycoside hydrolase family 76 protein [Thermothielavioides terrestris NRRL 8126]|uniref:Mannan endo-1,6-alpha-mannosidase n=1 Tax=Thermothielavioides terrestris (strain ATCC 38088 / NRRL 8126) TaxID=578455 RepID=G2RDW8_THETT|nr:glycoside hydrolase family 76 protein [Thermothielavioides terrestris NRRL 8126]AEO70851.1 glycoside hydrolase family 76 protein [Thermothielavioides terrestris NRRL 8126]